MQPINPSLDLLTMVCPMEGVVGWGATRLMLQWEEGMVHPGVGIIITQEEGEGTSQGCIERPSGMV